MEPEALSLVALSPSDLPATQSALVEWCDRKVEHIATVLTDLRQNLEIATRNRWGSRQSLARTIAREEKRSAYYGKIKAAVASGYLIIPNFPVNAFAVRVQEGSRPRWKSSTWINNDLQDAQPAQLPAGEGQYVDDHKVVQDASFTTADNKTIRRYTSNAFNPEIDFPLVGVKPVVLEAAERALALRIFDRIGVVQQRPKQDPILVGQVEFKKHQFNTRTATFFIAWWLNTEDL